MNTTTERIIRTDTIVCPECDKVQQANVTQHDGDPWPIHLESLDTGIDDIESGLRSIEDGIDSISEQV